MNDVLHELVSLDESSSEGVFCEWLGGELFRHMAALGAVTMILDRFEEENGVRFSVAWKFTDAAALNTYLDQHVARTGVSPVQQFPSGRLTCHHRIGRRLAEIATQTIRS